MVRGPELGMKENLEATHSVAGLSWTGPWTQVYPGERGPSRSCTELYFPLPLRCTQPTSPGTGRRLGVALCTRGCVHRCPMSPATPPTHTHSTSCETDLTAMTPSTQQRGRDSQWPQAPLQVVKNQHWMGSGLLTPQICNWIMLCLPGERPDWLKS